MKAFNIILSILVLLLAVALAVSSFFLYEKREIMLGGWDKLSRSVSNTATILDGKSGTTVGTKLTSDALHHTQYANLDAMLKELNDSATNIMKQRDQYVEALMNIGKTIEMKGIPADSSLSEIASSGESAQKIIDGVYNFKGRRDALVNSVARTGKIVGVNVNANELKSGDPANGLKALDDQLNKMIKQLNNYKAMAKELSQFSGSGSSDSDDVAATQKTIDAIKASIRDLQNKYNSSQRDLKNAQNTIKEYEALGKRRDSEIVGLNETIKVKEGENTQLKVIIGMDNDDVEIPWKDGSKEARQILRGKVIEVNEKFGFVVADFGKYTRVAQKLGNKISHVDPKIENGLKFNVVRGFDTPDVKLITKGATATNVADKCTVIEIMSEDSSDVKVGDDVIVDFVE